MRGVAWRVAALCGLLFSLLLPALPATAAPARIILLRHGEKGGPWILCDIGRERARALAAYYIGKDAQKSLFRPGETPKAILGISLHTLETIYPVADSWGMPVTFYAVMPEMVDGRFVIVNERLNQRTREAARDMLERPEWAGQTLVVNWEHDHITKPNLNVKTSAAGAGGSAPGTVPAVTLYDLLGLAALPGVPDNWPGDTYDYFWIIDFDQATGKPTALTMLKQEFGPPFENLPQNGWGEPEGQAAAATCTP
ncbi:histidine phosphatase family protein [Xanthobacter sp. KR7-65]|uniref:histidine phosphatase family protein n=1 Tax=Xanthobacter sp. KR7-65 TaxID=3156612 RepID=UPI0032B550E8